MLSKSVGFIARHPLAAVQRFSRYACRRLLCRTFRGNNADADRCIWIHPSTSDRSFFGLVSTLTRAGHQVLIPPKPSLLLDNGMYDSRIPSLQNVFLDSRPLQLQENSLRLPGMHSGNPTSTEPRILEICFDFYSPAHHPDQTFFWPFGMHPEALLLGLDRCAEEQHTAPSSEPRLIRILCAGNLSYPEYARSTINDHFGMLNRADIIGAVRRHFNAEIVTSPAALTTPSGPVQIALIDQATDGFPMAAYFQALQASDFLLCPPGVNHPHCHNIFEGLSRGCIPILQYDQLMRPTLKAGWNCLSFANESQLLATVTSALQMTHEQIMHMRQRCFAYASLTSDSCAVLKLLKQTSVKRVCLLNETASMPSTRFH